MLLSLSHHHATACGRLPLTPICVPTGRAWCGAHQTQDGSNPLHSLLTVVHDDDASDIFKVIDLLCEKGVEVNDRRPGDGKTALHLALRSGHRSPYTKKDAEKVVKYLIEKKSADIAIADTARADGRTVRTTGLTDVLGADMRALHSAHQGLFLQITWRGDQQQSVQIQIPSTLHTHHPPPNPHPRCPVSHGKRSSGRGPSTSPLMPAL